MFVARTADDVLRVARLELKTRERPNNNNKYGRAYGMNNTWWCQQFVWWVFWTAGAKTEMPKTAITRVAYPWYRKHRTIVSVADAEPGDVVWFDYSSDPDRKPVSHVGIVEKNLGGGLLRTIEGNCPPEHHPRHAADGVYRHTRRSKIVAVGRPNYLTGDDMPLTAADKPVIKAAVLDALKAATPYTSRGVESWAADRGWGNVTARGLLEYI